MDDFVNKKFFSNDAVILEYARAVKNVGLWNSEKILIEKFIPKSAKILELGAGAGRVSFALKNLGYENLTITDFAPKMVEMAKFFFEESDENSAKNPRSRASFAVEDATNLSFPSETFDAAIFAFNGLQMIPKRARREKALSEIARILTKNGILIFSGHDQTAPARKQHWSAEKTRWENKTRDPELDDFGDYNHETPNGKMFIHAAVPAEIGKMLAAAKLKKILSKMRSEICQENAAVHEFSDDTRFWVCQKS